MQAPVIVVGADPTGAATQARTDLPWENRFCSRPSFITSWSRCGATSLCSFGRAYTTHNASERQGPGKDGTAIAAARMSVCRYDRLSPRRK